MCVLIVEDDQDLRMTLVGIVSDAGYAAAHAANGLEALAVLDRIGPPCLLLTDVAMPLMDGIELADRVRELPQMGTVNIVFLTASRQRVPVGSHVLAKPLDLDDLEATLSWARPCRR
jgi:CheY-like chemotaxis protein